MKLLRIIAITVAVPLAALGAVTSARATSLVVSGGTPAQAAQLQRVVNRSDEPTPAMSIQVTIGPCEEGIENSCAFIPTTVGIQPHIWMVPTEEPSVILHELGHVSDWLLSSVPIREAFERIIGRQGVPWYGVPGEEYPQAPPAEEWADTLMSCSWMGRIARGPYVFTPTYNFKLAAKQYNRACAFFARVLVGPKFTQPTVAPLGPIPYDYDESGLCGARPGQAFYCGKPPPKTVYRFKHHPHHRNRPKKGKRSKKQR